MRTLLLGFFLFAACGRQPPPQGRPEDVARATFDALKAASIEPLESHLMTSEERRKVTGVDLDATAERERWETHIVWHHERLNVDWETAAAGAMKVKYGPMGVSANVALPITSARGTVTVDVAVTKVGRRFVFADVKAGVDAQTKQAAPEPEDEGGGG